jgi:predicted alpha/beta hydrolase family esterase
MSRFDEALLGFGVVVVAFIIVIVGYAIGSFFFMRSHTTARTLGVSVRELARETFLAALTQPFLPLYYLFGRRMDPFFVRPIRSFDSARVGVTKTPIVFVHGYMQNRVGFLGLAYALARRGIGPLYGFNYPWFTSITSNAARLDHFIERVREETKTGVVDLVCHSMGGLVAMEMMRRHADMQKRVRRCVTIATPHAGIAWRGPLIGIGTAALRRGSKLLEMHAGYTLAVPTLSVFSSHDNVVYPKETSHLVKRGGRDVEIQGYGHLAILFSAEVADHVASFLTSDEPSAAIVRAENDGRAHDPSKASDERAVVSRPRHRVGRSGGGGERDRVDKERHGDRGSEDGEELDEQRRGQL